MLVQILCMMAVIIYTLLCLSETIYTLVLIKIKIQPSLIGIMVRFFAQVLNKISLTIYGLDTLDQRFLITGTLINSFLTSRSSGRFVRSFIHEI